MTLFANSNESQKVTTGGNQLAMTAALTTHSMKLAKQLLDVISSNQDQWADYVIASMQSHDRMNELVDEVLHLGGVEEVAVETEDGEKEIVTEGIQAEDISYLNGVSESELEKMIRSQQSKRSRAKSKADPKTGRLSEENYKMMLTGAIAENLLRLHANKPKSSGGGVPRSETGFTDEELNEFRADQEKLKKAIRNVQSKKSIYLSKDGNTKDDPYYLRLLADEQTLKDIRDNGNSVVTTQIVEANKKAEEVLSTLPEDIKAEDALKILAELKGILLTREAE
jgi:hypothetical protein